MNLTRMAAHCAIGLMHPLVENRGHVLVLSQKVEKKRL